MSEVSLFETADARVDRTFAFIDLSEFTTYTDTHGDGEAVKVLSGFRSAVRDIASRRAVRIAKWLGDGAMLVAVEAEPGIEAVIDIERRIEEIGSPLPLRAGIAGGRVLLFEGDDYIGAPVNLASRLCDMARPREVLAPADLVSSLLVNTKALPIGSRHISGFAQPIEIVRLISAEVRV
jgi:class 3 adenylate cyclase